MIIIKFPQVSIENDIHLGIKGKFDLESHKKSEIMGSSTQLCIEKW